MTLIVAAQGEDFVIVGADSRGTITDMAGNRMELNLQLKIEKITEKATILLAGSAYQADYLIEKFKSTEKISDQDVSEIAESFAAFCRNEERIYSDITRKHPDYKFIIAGLKKVSKGKYVPRCYKIHGENGYRVGVYKQGFGLEGKPLLGYYIFSKKYEKSKNDLDNLIDLVVEVLYETSNVDGDVGGELRLSIIDERGTRPVQKGDIEKRLHKLKS